MKQTKASWVPAACVFMAIAQAFAFAESPDPRPGSVQFDIALGRDSRWVDISTPSAQQFDAELRGLLATADLASVAALRPYAFLLANRSAEHVRRLVVRYITRSSDGQRLLYSTNSLDFLDGSFGPGRSIAVLPVSYLTTRYFRRDMAEMAGAAGGPTPRGMVDQFLKQAAPAWNKWGVVVQLDSVTFSSGTVIGPDRYGVAVEAREREAAAREWIERLNSGAPQNDQLLNQWALADTTAMFRADGSVDHAALQRKQAALLVRQQLALGAPRELIQRALQVWAAGGFAGPEAR